MLTKEKPKILLITLRADLGGAPLNVNSILFGLSGKFNFYCASPLDYPFGLKWKKKLGANFLQLPHRKFIISAFIALVKFIIKNKINVVHSHGKGAGVYSRLVKILLPKIIVIHTFHGLHLPKNYLSRKLYLIYEWLFAKLTTEMINVSPSEKEIINNYGIIKNKKTKIIRNGIEYKSFDSGDVTNIRDKLKLPLEKVIIISVARFSYQKNIEELLEIAKLFLSDKKHLFLVIGDGEERNRIEELKEENKIENVLLLGPKENIDEYLFAADIYLTTSRWEGLPYSLIEAIRAGLPIVGTKVTGNIEVIKDKINGFLYEPGNIEAAKEYISRIEEDSKLSENLSQGSRKLFESEFLLNTMLDEYENLYHLYF